MGPPCQEGGAKQKIKTGRPKDRRGHVMSAPDKTPAIRLLVVDDDETLLEMMRERFERRGMKVFVTLQGGEALNIAMQERIDVVLLDVGLPDVSGLELLAQLR